LAEESASRTDFVTPAARAAHLLCVGHCPPAAHGAAEGDETVKTTILKARELVILSARLYFELATSATRILPGRQ